MGKRGRVSTRTAGAAAAIGGIAALLVVSGVARAVECDACRRCERWAACLPEHAPTSPAIAMDFDILWSIAGHYTAIVIAARAAGLDVRESVCLAYWSQYADDDCQLDAVRSIFTTCGLGRDQQRYLHSLRGEEAGPVREELAELIRENQDPIWVRGLLIHAYGDSWAHARPCSNGECVCSSDLYGWPFGHAFHGHAPDAIGTNERKFAAYVEGLSAALADPAKSPRPEILADLKDYLACVDFPTRDADDERSALTCFAAANGLLRSEPGKSTIASYVPRSSKPKLTGQQRRAWFAWVKKEGEKPGGHPPGECPP